MTDFEIEYSPSLMKSKGQRRKVGRKDRGYRPKLGNKVEKQIKQLYVF